jgi:hypothetical protein
MKSVYALFNEALAKLKEASAKKYDEVFSKFPQGATIEVKLNMVEAALNTVKESANPLGLEDIEEAKRDPAVAILFGIEPRQATTTKEAVPAVKMNNGAAQNFVEGSPFNEGRSNAVTETRSTRKDIFAKGDKVLREALGITETKPSGEYEKLTEAQRKEFDFARTIGLSEADAFTLVKITGGYKQVSRR